MMGLNMRTGFLFLSCVLLCASVHSGSAVSDTTTEKDACSTKLNTIHQNDPEFERLDKVYRQSLRFGGTAHRIVPRWHSTYEDMVDAKNKLTAKDIPYMVKELTLVDAPNMKLRVAMGVLGLFGDQALPCIEAALNDPGIKGGFTLQQIKIGIAADRPATK